jgi:hypothetical protein
MRKVRVHPRIREDNRDLLKQLVKLQNIQGISVSDGDVIDEALDRLNLRKLCEVESLKVKQMFEKGK